MKLLFVLFLLPFIYVFSWILAPILWLGGGTMMFIESSRMHVGFWSEVVLFMGIVFLIVYCFKSWKYLCFGLLPVLYIMAAIGHW